MADTCDIVKNGVIVATVACSAAFAQAASPTPPAGGSTRLEQAAIGGPAGKLAREYYAKPMNDASLEEVKKKLMELPRNEIRQAANTFNDLRVNELQSSHAIGDMMLATKPGQDPQQKDAEIRQKISEIQSPELKKGLTDLYAQVQEDFREGKGLVAVEHKREAFKALDEGAKNRETAFKTVVNEASREKMAIESQERRAAIKPQ